MMTDTTTLLASTSFIGRAAAAVKALTRGEGKEKAFGIS